MFTCLLYSSFWRVDSAPIVTSLFSIFYLHLHSMKFFNCLVNVTYNQGQESWDVVTCFLYECLFLPDFSFSGHTLSNTELLKHKWANSSLLHHTSFILFCDFLFYSWALLRDICWCKGSLTTALFDFPAGIPAGRVLLHGDRRVWHQVDHASLCPHPQTSWYVDFNGPCTPLLEKSNCFRKSRCLLTLFYCIIVISLNN